MPVGWGTVPFSSILFTYLHSYSGLIILELRSRFFGNLKESKTSMVQILNFLSSGQGTRFESRFMSPHRAT